MKYGKKFLIIGNKNAITYKEIFPYIKDNELWLGITNPDEYRLPNGEITQSVKGLCRWFTNIPHNRRNTPLDLYNKYSADEYPKYENYFGFNVNKVIDIPVDDFIDVEIPDEEYEKWKKVYGDDLVIIE